MSGSGHGGIPHGAEAHGAGTADSGQGSSTTTTAAQSCAKSLSQCVDAARQCVADMGLIPYRTYLVTIVWGGGRVGVGSPTVTQDEITPPPKLKAMSLRNELRPAGAHEEGNQLLTGITRQRAEEELWSPPGLDRTNTQFLYRITGALESDGVRDRWYTPARPPVLNAAGRQGQMEAMSWSVELRRVQSPGVSVA